MTELAFLALIVLAAAVGMLATVRDVHRDGLGRRHPPASHRDPFDPWARTS